MRLLLFIPLLQFARCGSSPPVTPWQDPATPWARHVIDSSSSGADGVKIMDVNSDGFLDITTGWEEGGLVRVYIHPGAASVKEIWPSVTVGHVASVEDAVFFDVGADGRVDVISSAEGDVRAMFLHRAPPNSADYQTASVWMQDTVSTTLDRMQWMFAIPFDVDADGLQDLVAAGKNEGAEIGWLDAGDASASTWTWHTLALAAWVMSIIPFDADGDGDLDIIYSDRKGENRGVYWLSYEHGNGESRFAPREYLGGNASEPMFTAVGDIQGDEAKEIVTATMYDGVLVLQRTSDGSWLPETILYPENTGTGKGVALGDLDGDGTNEIVLTTENAAGKYGVYFLRRTNRYWEAIDIGGLEGTKFDRIELIDLDLDGDLDVLTCEETENLGVIWYENIECRMPSVECRM